MTCPVAMSGAKSEVVAGRASSGLRRAVWPHRQHRCGPGFDPISRRRPDDGLSGRSEIEANRVAHLRTRSGSAESLIVFRRCGCRPKARQLRCTVETDRPQARDMPRELKWSASGSTLSSVRSGVRHPVDPPVLDGAAHPSEAHRAERRGDARQSHGASVPDRLGAGRHWLVLRALGAGPHDPCPQRQGLPAPHR